MKKVLLLAALFLCCTPIPGQTDGKPLPLDKKIIAEKLILAENYANALKKCRSRSQKSTRHSCLEQKKELLSKAFEDLDRDPKAYFAAQERNAITEKTLQESGKPIKPR